MADASETLRFGRYAFDASNLDKPLFPKEGITKGDVIAYYRNVARVALPHLRDRPVTLQRFPDGIDAEGFYQQRRPDHFPEFVGAVEADRVDDGTIEHVEVHNAAGLAYLADQAVITLHAWPARQDRLAYPDRLVFDLDPPGDDFAPVRRGARKVGDLLRDLGLTPYVMTTGSQGVHVVAPLDRSARFDAVRAFAKSVADLLATRFPDELTTEQRKEKRRGRLYLDVMRNAYGQTAVSPYCLRAKPGAPVATPLAWDELADRDVGPRSYTMRNVLRRLGQKDDPWAGMRRHAAGIDRAQERLASLEGDGGDVGG